MTVSEQELQALAQRVIRVCTERGIYLAIAESLTGGLVSSALTSVPGASKVLLHSVVAYHNAAKHQLLNVRTVTLASFGAVSAQTARAMAEGVRVALSPVPTIDASKIIGLSTTGVAGPDTQEGKPVGTLFVGLAMEQKSTDAGFALAGSREQIRIAAAAEALHFLLEQIAA